MVDVKSPTKKLPAVAALGRFLRSHAVLSETAFLAALPGASVFVRIDERGGADESAPWAVPALDVMSLPPSGPLGDDVFIDLGSMVDSVEATATGPSQPPLPLPRAREHATAYVVPAAGGRIGRAPVSAVVVGERSISRVHAEIARHEEDWTLIDAGSENGTGVNGLPLLPGEVRRLRSGDVVQLADVVLLFLDGASFHLHLPALAGG